MKLPFFRLQSLKTRVTLAVLLILIASLWSLSFLASRMLRQDIERVLGVQQYSAVTLLAGQINHEFENRLLALEGQATSATAVLLNNPGSLQSFIEERQTLQFLFNGGVAVTDAGGTVIADVPPAAGRTGSSLREDESVASALQQGKSAIGRPFLGKALKSPVLGTSLQSPLFVMAAPILDRQGKVIGALVGFIHLGIPNFLDQVTENRYGKSGSYLLIAPKNKLIVTSTERQSVMAPLPVPGTSPGIDRFIDGYEGTAVHINPRDIEMLSSAKRIPAADWIIVADLPTTEAFEPIREMQGYMLKATAILSLLVVTLIGWLLQKQLAPLQSTAGRLSSLPEGEVPQAPLPVTRDDEVGQLVSAFNKTLESLRQREMALRESEERFRTLHDASFGGIMIHDHGTILDCNQGLSDLTGYAHEELVGMSALELVTPNWRDEIRSKIQSGFDLPYEVTGLRKDGSEYPLRILGKNVRRHGKTVRVTESRDISEQKRTEDALRDSHESLQSILNTTQDGFWRIDTTGHLLDVNSAYCRLSGYSREELVGQHIALVEAQKDADQITERIRQAIEQSNDQFETRHRRKDGSIWDVEVSTSFHNSERKEVFVFMRDITERKQTAEMLEKRIIALTQPLSGGPIAFEDLFQLDEIQRIQDEFAEATGVASIITHPDGSPITRPSNFTRLCSEIIRKTEVGCANCFKSDASIGRYHPEGPIIQPCMSGGLWDAGTSITVGGQHIANWLIGQVRDATQTEEQMRSYANRIGTAEDAFMAAYREVPTMSQDRFGKVAQALFTMANQLSTSAYNYVQQARFISERRQTQDALQESEARFKELFDNAPICYHEIDVEGRITRINHTEQEMLGYSTEEMLGHHVWEFAQEASISMKAVHDKLAGILPTGDSYKRHYRKKDGTSIPMLFHEMLIHDHAGKINGIRTTMQDITELAEAEEALRKSEASFRNFFEQNSSVLLLTDPVTGEIIDANEAASQFYGYPRSRLLLMNISVINTLPPEIIAEKRLLAVRGEHKTFIFQHRLASGELRDVEAHLSPINSGGRTLLFSIVHDITERKKAEEKLHLAASVFSHAREGILITGTDGAIIDVNDSFTRITGYARDEVIGKNPRLLASGRQNKEFYATLWEALSSKGHWYGELWNRRKNGEIFAVLQTISTVCDARGTPRQYVSLFSDITSIKEHEKQLEHIAHYDVLTTLPNRVLLADRLKQAMAQTERRGQLLAVAYLDLDGFKAINDRHGHETGDHLLITLAGRMKQTLREGDTLARLGGDEFIAVLLDLSDISASVPMINRLLSAAAMPVHVDDRVLQVSASLGVTFYPQSEEVDADQLLRQADQAMYQAKLAGKNRYHLFDTEQDRSVRGHHESLEHIRHALVAREFVLHYQPKVNMRTGAIIGAEALIRWQHPEKGLLPPSVFLPVIDDHPIAVDIGEWVIENALSQIDLWRAIGLDIPVSINVGARQLLHSDFVQRLRSILAKHPSIRPGDLEIEVLETSALEDLARVSQIIEDCREIGTTFSLDDFGTGYSSLTYLKRLAVNQLKIDQSFVRDMLDDPDDLSILSGILSLAASFRRQIIAEGVETIDHGTMLLQLGCEQAQGYGIARPMPADDLPIWVSSWHSHPAWLRSRAVSREDLPLLFARVEHRAWIIAVEDFVRGKRESMPPAHHQCRFCEWLDTQGKARHHAHSAFHPVVTLHRQLHEMVQKMCEARHTGQGREALDRLAELHELREALLAQMNKLLHGR